MEIMLAYCKNVCIMEITLMKCIMNGIWYLTVYNMVNCYLNSNKLLENLKWESQLIGCGLGGTVSIDAQCHVISVFKGVSLLLWQKSNTEVQYHD